MVQTTLTVKRIPLEALHQDPANARQHGPENMDAITASLQRFGQAEPLVVQAKTGRVIGGNGRLAAMRKLGWSECEIVELDVDDLQATAIAIALNRTAELAEWDEPVLARLLEELRAEDALCGVGFDDDEIDALLAGLDGEDRGELEDPGAQDPSEAPVTKPGDLWVLGDHRLLCGDSTSPEDVAGLMSGEMAALLATDPPYLVDYDGTNHPAEHHRRAGRKAPKKPGSDLGNKRWDDYVDPETSVAFFRRFLELGLARCRDDVAIYQWHATRRQALVEQAWTELDLLIHQTIVWSKSRGVLTRSHFLWRHEPCFYGWRRGRQPEKDRRPPPNMTTVWEVGQAGEQDGIHPTQKARDLFRWPIEWHTRRGEIVYEPFSGSGTQIIAAEELGRRCFAMELAPAFVDAAVLRWEKATGAEAVLEESGESFVITAERRSA